MQEKDLLSLNDWRELMTGCTLYTVWYFLLPSFSTPARAIYIGYTQAGKYNRCFWLSSSTLLRILYYAVQHYTAPCVVLPFISQYHHHCTSFLLSYPSKLWTPLLISHDASFIFFHSPSLKWISLDVTCDGGGRSGHGEMSCNLPRVIPAAALWRK